MPCTVHHRRRRHNAMALAICVTLSLSCCASWCHPLCIVVTLWHWPSALHRCHCHHCSRQPSPSPSFPPAIVIVVFLRLAWTHCHRGIGCHRHCHHDTRDCAIVAVIPVLPLSHLHHGCGDVIALACMAVHPGGRLLWSWLHHQ